MRDRVLRLGAMGMLAVVVIVAAVAGYRAVTRPTTITAVFTSATGIYVGDDVRVAGVKVGTIRSITPQGETVRMTLAVNRGVKIPASAHAVVVAQNLVADRFVQLAPAFVTSGPVLADGATIGVDRTAVPVEWDEVKNQLTRLAGDLGPQSGNGSSLGRFIDSTSRALEGNGDTVGESLTQLSRLGRTLADNDGNITQTIRNLATFVGAVRGSGEQIVQFENRLATLSSVLDGSRSDLDSAVTELSRAVVDVQRFVRENRGRASEQVQRLAAVTQNLVDHRGDLEQLLFAFPNNLSNLYNIYDPDTGTQTGGFAVNNFSNPVQFICSSIASIENLTAAEGARRCQQYLGPVASLIQFNYLPVPINPILAPNGNPKNIIYSEDRLRPTDPDTTGPRPTRDQLLMPQGRR